MAGWPPDFKRGYIMLGLFRSGAEQPISVGDKLVLRGCWRKTRGKGYAVAMDNVGPNDRMGYYKIQVTDVAKFKAASERYARRQEKKMKPAWTPEEQAAWKAMMVKP